MRNLPYDSISSSFEKTMCDEVKHSQVVERQGPEDRFRLLAAFRE